MWLTRFLILSCFSAHFSAHLARASSAQLSSSFWSSLPARLSSAHQIEKISGSAQLELLKFPARSTSIPREFFWIMRRNISGLWIFCKELLALLRRKLDHHVSSLLGRKRFSVWLQLCISNVFDALQHLILQNIWMHWNIINVYFNYAMGTNVNSIQQSIRLSCTYT